MITLTACYLHRLGVGFSYDPFQIEDNLYHNKFDLIFIYYCRLRIHVLILAVKVDTQVLQILAI